MLAERESLQRQLNRVDEALPPWENENRDPKECVGRVDTIRNLVADRAERDRLREDCADLERGAQLAVQLLTRLTEFIPTGDPLRAEFYGKLADVRAALSGEQT